MTEQESAFNSARAAVLKALAHPSRLYIVEKLRDKPHCVCELTGLIGADTSTISKHLSVLKAAGIVRDRKEGTTVYYSLACSCIVDILASVENIVRSHVEQQQTALEGMTSAVT